MGGELVLRDGFALVLRGGFCAIGAREIARKSETLRNGVRCRGILWSGEN
jgi:hypothetical protein